MKPDSFAQATEEIAEMATMQYYVLYPVAADSLSETVNWKYFSRWCRNCKSFEEPFGITKSSRFREPINVTSHETYK